MKPAASDLARIKQLCSLGLPSERIMPALLSQMHRVIPGYAYNFFWIDEGLQVCNAYHENFEETRVTVPLFLAEFCNRRETEVITSFAEAIKKDRGVKTIEDSLKVSKRAYHRHDYYNLVMRPSNYLDSMRIVLRENGRAVGALLVHRDRPEGKFTLQEKQWMTELAPFVAHAVSAADSDASAVPLVEHEASGLIVADMAGKIRFILPEGRRLLFLATHPRVATRTPTPFSIPVRCLRT